MIEQRPKHSWRVTVGIAIFVVSIGWPVVIPLLPLLGASAMTTAAFSGVMVMVADLMLVAGAAIAGKEGFALIKAKVFGCLKSYGPPREVSRRRYTMGLLMFATSVAFGWASPYFGHHIPGFASNEATYAVALDMMLLVSLFVLGAGFWDKLRSLLMHEAHAVIPSAESDD